MATYALDFEKPLLELETKLAELKRHAATGEGSGTAGNLDGEIRRLEKRCARLQQEIFNELSRWQVVQLSRHPNRPYMLDYVQRLFTDWAELHGDRSFGDDQALIGGLARFDGEPVMLIGQQKGRSTKENIARSFGMPRPEGYRKALRLMKLAERFGRPVIAFIDTPGAYPGIDAEERGQAEAIAVCLEEMAGLLVPVISVVIGEGGSGGALAIGVCNRLLMLQYSWYSVISPESCAAILYRDDQGVTVDVVDIPANLLDEANKHRERMVEAVAESDDELTHKFLEGEVLRKGHPVSHVGTLPHQPSVGERSRVDWPRCGIRWDSTSDCSHVGTRSCAGWRRRQGSAQARVWPSANRTAAIKSSGVNGLWR